MPTPPPASRAVPPPSAAALAFAWGGGALFVGALASFVYAYLVRFQRAAGTGPALGAVLVDCALFSAFALHHSLLARAGVKVWLRRWIPIALERSLYTWVASLLLLAACWAWRPVPGVLYVLPGWVAWLGFAAQAGGVVLTIAGSRAIDVLDLAGIRALLPARSASTAEHVPLMTTGAYGIVRHPVYLGWALFTFGAPTMTATRAVFAVVSTGYLAMAIPWEERSLIATFGEAYRDVPPPGSLADAAVAVLIRGATSRWRRSAPHGASQGSRDDRQVGTRRRELV